MYHDIGGRANVPFQMLERTPPGSTALAWNPRMSLLSNAGTGHYPQTASKLHKKATQGAKFQNSCLCKEDWRVGIGVLSHMPSLIGGLDPPISIDHCHFMMWHQSMHSSLTLPSAINCTHFNHEPSVRWKLRSQKMVIITHTQTTPT